MSECKANGAPQLQPSKSEVLRTVWKEHCHRLGVPTSCPLSQGFRWSKRLDHRQHEAYCPQTLSVIITDIQNVLEGQRSTDKNKKGARRDVGSDKAHEEEEHQG
mgnify:CR=1 FL=1